MNERTSSDTPQVNGGQPLRDLRPSERGAIGRVLAVGLGIFVLLMLIGGGCTISKYNQIVTNQEDVEAKWSGIDNQYKRRADVIGNLVTTVQEAADFEKGLLTELTEARASVGRVQLPSELPTDPAQLQAFMQAQQGLGSVLGRLFAVSENYPNLKANENFLALQDQLEGTENRIAVARSDYINSVKTYNTSIRRFPGNFIASFGGFEKAAQLTVEPESREVPEVSFE